MTARDRRSKFLRAAWARDVVSVSGVHAIASALDARTAVERASAALWLGYAPEAVQAGLQQWHDRQVVAA